MHPDRRSASAHAAAETRPSDSSCPRSSLTCSAKPSGTPASTASATWATISSTEQAPPAIASSTIAADPFRRWVSQLAGLNTSASSSKRRIAVSAGKFRCQRMDRRSCGARRAAIRRTSGRVLHPGSGGVARPRRRRAVRLVLPCEAVDVPRATDVHDAVHLLAGILRVAGTLRIVRGLRRVVIGIAIVEPPVGNLVEPEEVLTVVVGLADRGREAAHLDFAAHPLVAVHVGGHLRRLLLLRARLAAILACGCARNGGRGRRPHGQYDRHGERAFQEFAAVEFHSALTIATLAHNSKGATTVRR